MQLPAVTKYWVEASGFSTVPVHSSAVKVMIPSRAVARSSRSGVAKAMAAIYDTDVSSLTRFSKTNLYKKTLRKRDTFMAAETFMISTQTAAVS